MSHNRNAPPRTQPSLNDKINSKDLVFDESDEVYTLPPQHPPEDKPFSLIATQCNRVANGNNLDEVVNDIIKSVLALQVTKQMLTREKIKKTIFSKRGISSRKNYEPCMRLAKKRLLSEFGFQLKEIHTSKTQTHYILIDKPSQEDSLKACDGMLEFEKVQHGIMMIIMALTLLNNEEIHPDTLLSHLQDLGIANVPGFDGSIMDFIDQEMVKKKYLNRTQATDFDEATSDIDKRYKYSLGVRVYAEIGKDGLYGWISSVHGEELGESERDSLRKETKKFLSENYDEFGDKSLVGERDEDN
ncbi:MAGE domain-containing protein [Entamoeba marina]